MSSARILPSTLTLQSNTLWVEPAAGANVCLTKSNHYIVVFDKKKKRIVEVRAIGETLPELKGNERYVVVYRNKIYTYPPLPAP